MNKLFQYLCCRPAYEDDNSSEEKTALLHEENALTHSPSLAATSQSSTPLYNPYPHGGSMSYHPAHARTTAANIVSALVNPSKSSTPQTAALTIEREVVAYGGWDEWLAENVMNKLIDLVQAGDTDSWGESFKKAVDEAKKVANEVFEWAGDHPMLATAVVCVIVFGALELVCPWVLEVLGFGEIGIVEGQFYFFGFLHFCSCC